MADALKPLCVQSGGQSDLAKI